MSRSQFKLQILNFKQYRIRLLFMILLITPLGFASKFYGGPFEAWVNDSLGGVLYEIFWCFATAFFLPKVRPQKIALWVFITTCFLEVLQLWHPPFLTVIRSHFIGQTLLGTSFSWLDFPHYAAGCVLGWYLVNRLKRK